MKKFILIAVIAISLIACNSKNSDTTEDNNLEGQQTELGMDSSDASGNSGMGNTGSGSMGNSMYPDTNRAVQ